MSIAIQNINQKRCHATIVQTHMRQKQVNLTAFKKFASLLLSPVYAMVVPEVRFLIFNKRITNCLYEHALLKRIKVTSPPSFCTMVKRARSQYTTTMNQKVRLH